MREAELDLVARDGEELVFVEVRTRRGGEAGHGGALGEQAQEREGAARRAVVHRAASGAGGAALMRVDVVTVELARDGTLRRVTHYEDAVRA